LGLNLFVQTDLRKNFVIFLENMCTLIFRLALKIPALDEKLLYENKIEG